MIAREDLLEYVQLPDGLVDISIVFNENRTVTLTINRARQPETVYLNWPGIPGLLH
jgi:hypothetical protein